MARASIMSLTGDAINAATALEFGLVTEVVEPETCLDRALDIADRIAANPGHSTRLAKRLLREGQDMTLGPLLELSAAYQALAHHTHDHLEAVDAFLAKSRPVWVDVCRKLRSEELSVGKEGVRRCRTRWTQDIKKKK